MNFGGACGRLPVNNAGKWRRRRLRGPHATGNDEQERWLKDYFRTKSAGAEFILPWAVDTFFRAMANIKQMFTAGELKTIVEAHKDTRLLPDHTRLSYLLLRVSDA